MEYAFVLQTYQIIIPVIQHTLPERFLGKDCKGQKKKKGHCLFVWVLLFGLSGGVKLDDFL